MLFFSKQKKFRNLRLNFKRSILALVIMCMGMGFFAPALVSEAQQAAAPAAPVKIKPGSIAYSLDFLVNNKNDNLVKVVKGQPVNVQVAITVTQAQESNTNRALQQINVGTDLVDFNIALDVNRALSEIGAGVESSASANQDCSQQVVTNIIPTGDNSSYTACSFASSHKAISTNPVVIGKAYTVNLSFTADDNTIRSLGLDKPCPRNATNTPCFSIFPYFKMRNPLFDDMITNPSAGKDIYLQVYNSDSDLQNDVNNRPQDIPGYGSLTSSSGATKTGGLLLGLVNELIGILVGLLRSIIYFLHFAFVVPALVAEFNIRTYSDTFAAVVYPGWIVVRNLANTVLALVLIVIGLGTLFRVEAYQYKSLLVTLIISALMINFSMVIGQVVFGVAEAAQNQFLPNNSDVIRGLGRDLMVGWDNVDFSIGGAYDAGFFANTIKPMFGLALSLGSFFTFATLAVTLFATLIYKWVLLLTGPLAFVARILPQTKSYAGKWWSELVKNAFYPVVIGFFLNMAAVINSTYNATVNGQNSVFRQIINDPSILGDSSLAQFVFKVGSNFIILFMLLAAVKVAEQSGVYGADIMAKATKAGMFAPFKGTSFARNRAARWWNDFTVNNIRGHALSASWGRSIAFAVANPVAFAKGWKKRSEELSHEATERAELAGLEVVEQRLTGGKKVIPRVQQFERQHEDKFAKDFNNMSRELVVNTAQRLLGIKNNEEGRAIKRAIFKTAFSKGYIDDIVQDASDPSTAGGREFIKALKATGLVKEPEEAGWEEDWDYVDIKDKFGNVLKNPDGTNQKKKRLKYNDKTRHATYAAFFKRNGRWDTAAMRMITEEGEREGKDTRHFEFMRNFLFNIQQGEWNESFDRELFEQGKNSEGDLFANVEASKMTSRQQADAAWHSIMDGAVKGRRLNKGMFRVLSKAWWENPMFSQERVANKAIFNETDGMSKQQKDHYEENGKILVNEDNARFIKDMAGVDAKGMIGLYARSVNRAKDVPWMEELYKSGKLEVDIVDDNGNKTGQSQTITWRPAELSPAEKAKLNKLKGEKSEQDKEKKESKSQNEQMIQLLQQLAANQGGGGAAAPSGVAPKGGKRKRGRA